MVQKCPTVEHMTWDTGCIVYYHYMTNLSQMVQKCPTVEHMTWDLSTYRALGPNIATG